MKRIGIILMMALSTVQKVYSQNVGREGGHDTATVFAQGKGIAFENHLSWQQVLQKAKAENKYIFVDCYASRCGLCRWMDQNIYNNDTIGAFMNKTFISVRMQMDTGENDNAEIREWYSIAHEMGEKYQIGAYPTYLFCSAEGRAVHKATGIANVRDFFLIARSAADSQEQFYTLLTKYQQGSIASGLLPYMANTAKKLHYDSLSSAIAVEYLHYLKKLTDENLWTKENIEFIGEYISFVHYGDAIFQRYIHSRNEIDSVIGIGSYADRLIDLVAYREEVNWRVEAGIKNSSKPRWHFIKRTIKRRYGSAFVKKNMLIGRKVYYHGIGNWSKYARYFVLEMKGADIENWPPGLGTSLALNNNAMEVFKYSRRRGELEEALSWIDRALKMNVYQAQELDTKANLLYKLGKREEAIDLEEKSLILSPMDKEMQENYDKMKNCQPTW